MRLKTLIASLIFGSLLFLSDIYAKASDVVTVYFFYGQGCPHCAKELDFLEGLADVDDSIILHSYEVYNDMEGREKLMEAADKLDVEISGVPFLIIGNKYLVGYMSEETTGVEIVKLIEEYKQDGCLDIFNPTDTEVIDKTERERITDETTGPESVIEKDAVSVIEDELSDTIISSEEEKCAPSEEIAKPALPQFGNIDMEKLSLPVLTVVLGFLDGFNPCAMWVLLFLISLLIAMEDRKKMWFLGISFIIASAFAYFIFMVAWLSLFQFVGYISWVRTTIALIAFFGGYSSLRKFFSKDPSGCDIGGDEKKRRIFDNLGKITSNKSFLLSLVGIVGLALAVNLVELVCSAGLPAVYTQVLSMNEMVGLNYYLYILLYILFFMLDDLFVFFVAMITLRMTGITTKYVKHTRFVGGLLMVAVGILLLFKPELLMFG